MIGRCSRCRDTNPFLFRGKVCGAEGVSPATPIVKRHSGREPEKGFLFCRKTGAQCRLLTVVKNRKEARQIQIGRRLIAGLNHSCNKRHSVACLLQKPQNTGLAQPP